MGLMLDTNVFIHSERSRSPIDFSQWKEYGDVLGLNAPPLNSFAPAFCTDLAMDNTCS